MGIAISGASDNNALRGRAEYIVAGFVWTCQGLRLSARTSQLTDARCDIATTIAWDIQARNGPIGSLEANRFEDCGTCQGGSVGQNKAEAWMDRGEMADGEGRKLGIGG